jgi:uncharacterized protein YigE (DUF2233 family)
MKPGFILVCFFLAGLSVSGCGATPQPETPTPTSTPVPTTTRIPTFTPTASPTANPFPTLLHSPDSGWQVLRPGLERRVIGVFDAQGLWVESLYILRLNPSDFRFDVAYSPAGKLLETWRQDTGALIVVNGGYFREENGQFIPTGLTIINREVMGTSYEGFGGMFAVTAHGPELRWLPQRPYIPGEPLLAALQSFPMLVKPGGALGFPQEYEDNLQARRTVIAQDKNGRFLLMVANQGAFTLHQLSAYLTNSDLNLDIALNLDGGPSSGILLAEPREEIPAFNYLPIVITVYAR